MDLSVRAVVLWFLLRYCSGKSTDNNKVEPKIIGGGVPIDYNSDYTFTVAIQKDDTDCSGIVLQAEWVLTTAHCLENVIGDRGASVVEKRVGFRRERIYGNSIYRHPLYNNNTLEFDVALIRLESFLNTTFRTPGKLFLGNVDDLRDNRAKCYMTSMGKADLLPDDPYWYPFGFAYRKLDVSLKYDSKCSDFKNFNNIQHFCYKGKPSGGPCKGDDGAPITCDIDGEEQQIGLNQATSCESRPMQAISFAPVYDWINKTIKEYSYPRCPAYPKFRNGKVIYVNLTTAAVVCDPGYESVPAFPPHLTCEFTDINSLEGHWNNVKTTCKRYRCKTAGKSFMASFIYEDNWPGRYPAMFFQIRRRTEVNLYIPGLDFNGFYIFDNTVSFTFSKAIYGLNVTTPQMLGISVTTNKPIKVWVYQYTLGGVPGEGSFVLPEQCASKRHTLFRTTALYRFSQAVIVSLTDNTNVTLIGENDEILSSVTLNRFEGYRPAWFGHGFVVSDANVVVFTGHECGEWPSEKKEECSYLIEQVPPDPLLGETYIVTNFRPVKYFTAVVLHPYPYPSQYGPGDVFRFWYATTPDNVNEGTFYYVSSTSPFSDIVIQCNRPCIVYAFSNDRSDDLNVKDNCISHPPVNYSPSPIGQFEPQYNFNVGINGGVLTVTIDDKYGTSGLQLNGLPLAKYTEANSTYTTTAVIPDVGSFVSIQFAAFPGYFTMTHKKRRATFSVRFHGFFNYEFGYATQMGRKV